MAVFCFLVHNEFVKYVAKNLSETRALAKQFVSGLSAGSQATVLGLYGDLGAGKTAFMQGVAEALGVDGEVTSPTFVLMKIYALSGKQFSRLVHIDAYRLTGPEELRPLGWDGLVRDPRNLIAVEWAERIESALPEDALRIHMEFVDDHTRGIEIAEKR